MTALDIVKTFLDETFHDVGEDCPLFPVMVILFSAALFRNASVEFLFDFTGYRKDFIEAISINMTNNRLWECAVITYLREALKRHNSCTCSTFDERASH